MRKNIIIITILFSSCIKDTNHNLKYFEKVAWGIENDVWIDNLFYHSAIKYDKNLNKMVGDTFFPIHLTDSTLTYNNNWAVKVGKNMKDTLISETIRYDIKEIEGTKKLFLYNDYEVVNILTTKDDLKDFEETNNYKSIKFEIDGFSIGDTISRSEIKENYIQDNKDCLVEVVYLKSKPNVRLEIIGLKHILKINTPIEKKELKSVIDLITRKMGTEPKHDKFIVDPNNFGNEYYSWYKNGLSVSLLGLYYVNNKRDFFAKQDYWQLNCSNNISGKILIEKYKNITPISTKIK